MENWEFRFRRLRNRLSDFDDTQTTGSGQHARNEISISGHVGGLANSPIAAVGFVPCLPFSLLTVRAIDSVCVRACARVCVRAILK